MPKFKYDHAKMMQVIKSHAPDHKVGQALPRGKAKHIFKDAQKIFPDMHYTSASGLVACIARDGLISSTWVKAHADAKPVETPVRPSSPMNRLDSIEATQQRIEDKLDALLAVWM